MSNLKYIAQNLETNLDELCKFEASFNDDLSSIEARCLKKGMDDLFKLFLLVDYLKRKENV